MKMICPHCGVNGSADDSLLGKQVKCPKCLELFKITSEIVEPIPFDEIELQQIDEPPTTDQTPQNVTEETDDTFDDIFGDEELVSGRIADERVVRAEEELELTAEESEFDEEESELLKLLNQEFVNEPDEESEEEPVAALSGVGQEDGEDLEEWGDRDSALSDFSDDDFAEQGVFDKTESDEDDDNTLTVIEDFPSDANQLDLEEETETEIVLEDKDIFEDTDDDWDIAAEVAEEPDQVVESDDEDIEEWNLAAEVAEESTPAADTDDEDAEDAEEWNLTADVAEESTPAVDTVDEDAEEWNLSAEVAEESAPAADTVDEDVEEWNLSAEVAEESAPTVDTVDEDAEEWNLSAEDAEEFAPAVDTVDEDVEEWNLTAEVAEESAQTVDTDDEDTEEWDLATEVDNFDRDEKEEDEFATEVDEYSVDDDAGDTELNADKEEDSDEEAIQKCSACGEYIDPTSKHEHGANVYCAKCVPAGDLGEDSDEAAATVPVAAAAPSIGKFTIITLIKDSWRYCKGVKGSIWAALIVMNVVLLGIGALSFFVLPSLLNTAGMNPTMIGAGVQVVASFLSYFFTAGIILIAVKKVGGQPYSWKMVFSGFRKIGTLVWAVILQMILLTIGFCLFILPGIYLCVGYILTIPLIMEKGLSPWQAMEASRKAIHKRWWTVLFTFIGMSILSTLSAIPAGIGLIWTVPMCFVLVGILYYHFFGDDE